MFGSNRQSKYPVRVLNRRDLPQAVEYTLDVCRSQLAAAENDASKIYLAYELRIAINSLEGIQKLWNEGDHRNREKYNPHFIHYVNHTSRESVEIEEALIDLIEQIESRYYDPPWLWWFLWLFG